jgi:hypothetical protein
MPRSVARGYAALSAVRLCLTFASHFHFEAAPPSNIVEAQPHPPPLLLEFLHQLVQNTPAQQNGRRTHVRFKPTAAFAPRLSF